ncbi:hypothetical protein [Mucilaginibacter aquariorum]|uniref:Uncharacterized protein n=1 Tax=Mucilaginibacter aquariorum TaxID=2967225 RepID=A0ABT1SXW3_9SPHI|nr:hypothetical protein [Mucilaginibacter aquariorum]MCQ6957050.1 hypothetical protein [Mucilaginibacter aquariorum]
MKHPLCFRLIHTLIRQQALDFLIKFQVRKPNVFTLYFPLPDRKTFFTERTKSAAKFVP